MKTDMHQNWVVRKPGARGPKGAVACQHLAAAEIGADVLREGGNAVDAAIAVSLAISVLEPWMSGIGGCGYMQVAKGGAYETVDFGTVAPQRLDPADYPLVGSGQGGDLFSWPAVKDDRNVLGYHSIALPTHLAGIGLAHERHGTLPWKRLVEPAVELARRGHPVSWNTMLRVCEAAAGLRDYETSRAVWLPDGLPPVAQLTNAMRHLPLGRLADTLDTVARDGWRAFYTGDIAASLVADLNAGGCPITREELDAFRARVAPTLAFRFGPVTVHAVDGLTAGPTLRDVLGRVADGTLAGRAPGPDVYALWARSLAGAYDTRLATMGDSDGAPEEGCTTHLTVVDGEGNMVALTQTLLSIFGSRVVLPGTGVLMNNGIMWFDTRPDRPNGLHPGRRPLCNMCPVVLERDGSPWAALGASGGRRIMPAVFQLICYLAAFGMSLDDACHEPRIDVSGEGRAFVDPRLGSAVQAAIAAHMPAEFVESAPFPTGYACPNGVQREAGGFAAMSHVMTAPSGSVAA